jgi:hypothetical protein
MSSACDVHKAFIFEWHRGEGPEEGPIIIYKWTRESCLGGFGPAYEIVCDVPSSNSIPNSLQVKETTIYTTKQSNVTAREGNFLDKDWIDLQTIKDWYRLYQHGHGTTCGLPLFLQHLNSRPASLIDTDNNCVIAARAGDTYVALSYVWGDAKSLQLTKENTETLQSPGALRRRGLRELIPNTVLHAMSSVPLMGERYLCVDSLCIVQDEEDDRKQAQLNSMAAIYTNANLAFVAADNLDAAYGLHGIQEVSQSVKRTTNQKIDPFGPHRAMTKRIFPAMNKRRIEDPKVYITNGRGLGKNTCSQKYG